LLSFFFLAIASDASAASGLKVVHSFVGTDGAFPSAALLLGGDGNFYGTTQSGGTFDRGTVFRMTPAGVVTVLHSFSGAADGSSPLAALIQANDGNFYGTTSGCGPTTCSPALGFGTVFVITPGGTLTTIHTFAGGTDGALPRAALLQASDGNLYGTTQLGGSFNRGTLFGMSLSGAPVFQYTFTGGTDGAFPYAPVIQARDGALYGTVYSGDVSTFGRVFRLTGTTVTAVHTFTGSDGANPVSALSQGADGNFYGTTFFGGAFKQGAAFRMAPNGATTLLKSFSGGVDGANPNTGLIQLGDGNFYGAAKAGAADKGILFKMTPGGVTTVLHTFTGRSNDGATPVSPLIAVSPGKLFSTAIDGGAGAKGVVFQLGTATVGDFDIDGKTDVSVFRPSTGTWFVLGSTTNATIRWGASGDIPVPGDYDGDGNTDAAVFRPSDGVWYVKLSGSSTTTAVSWGASGDIPAPGDYDGDGITDAAVFRPSTGIWYIFQSGTRTGITYNWGGNGDIPAAGDYDGDGRTDVAIFRPSSGVWYIIKSRTGTGSLFTWGANGDIPVPGDYDGDFSTDIAIFRPSTGVWYVVKSSTGTGLLTQWGVNGDVPVPGDYDGDGKSDIAIWRPSDGTWYIVKSSTGTFTASQWGVSDDIPILKR